MNPITFRLLFLIPSIILAMQANFAQWNLQSPLPTHYNIAKVDFPTADTGYILAGSRILQTFDGGVTWSKMPFPLPGLNINHFNFNSTLQACLLASNTVFTTHNGGVSWHQKAIATASAILGSHFVNDTLGLVYGEHKLLARTVDGGITWQLLSNTSLGDIIFTGMDFANAQTGYLSAHAGNYPGMPILQRTNDGGLSWTNINTPPEVERIGGLAVLSPDELWLGAYNVFPNPGGYAWRARAYHTTDGGATWVMHDLGISNNSPGGVIGIKVLSVNTIKMLNSRHIYSTSDGGTTWHDNYFYDPNSTSSRFKSFSWPDTNTCYIAGSGPALNKSTDGGSNFENLIHGHTNSHRAVHFTSPSSGCVAGTGQMRAVIYYTQDGGATWIPSQLDTVPYGNQIYALGFSTPEIGWAASTGNVLFKTTDAGINWNLTSTGFNYWLRLMSVPDSQHIYLGSTNGDLIRSNDQGLTWADVSHDIKDNTVEGGFVFADSLHGYIALKSNNSNTGKILKTDDGGISWRGVDYGSSQRIVAMSFCNAVSGMISLYNSKILVTHNGGDTWFESDIEPPFPVTYLKMFDSQTGVATIAGNYVAVTNDGGLSFHEEFEGSNGWPMFHFSFFLNENLGWGCASQGMIMRYESAATGLPPPLNIIKSEQQVFFPNPASGIIYFLNRDIQSLKIISLEGKTIYRKDHSFQDGLEISWLNPGTYIVQALTPTGYKHQKLLKFK